MCSTLLEGISLIITEIQASKVRSISGETYSIKDIVQTFQAQKLKVRMEFFGVKSWNRFLETPLNKFLYEKFRY